jgi:F420-non-reducing hydrogenase iron-sulfur subunit
MRGASRGRPFFPRIMTTMEKGLSFAIFFCQRLDPDQDVNRRALERELGPRIKFFPLPCSGRIEALHLMRALESGADKLFVITCPVGACRYLEGNLRAGKRLAFAQKLLEEIGLEPERFELNHASSPGPVSIDLLVRHLIDKEQRVSASPFKRRREKDKQREPRAAG